ncbi:pectate lyase [Streptomyces badius]
MSSAVIREAAGSAGSIRAWRLLDADAGTVLASGEGAGTVSFPRTTLRKITFEIVSSTGTPKIAEYETYAR